MKLQDRATDITINESGIIWNWNAKHILLDKFPFAGICETTGCRLGNVYRSDGSHRGYCGMAVCERSLMHFIFPVLPLVALLC